MFCMHGFTFMTSQEGCEHKFSSCCAQDLSLLFQITFFHRSPSAALMSILATQELLLENILECIPVGEFAVIQPLSDEFCLVLGYLLTWKLTLAFFKAASSQVYIHSLFLTEFLSLLIQFQSRSFIQPFYSFNYVTSYSLFL